VEGIRKKLEELRHLYARKHHSDLHTQKRKRIHARTHTHALGACTRTCMHTHAHTHCVYTRNVCGLHTCKCVSRAHAKSHEKTHTQTHTQTHKLTRTRAHSTSQRSTVQGGEDPQDTSSCRSFSAKEPLFIGLFCGKRHIKIRHPRSLCHPGNADEP